MLKRKIIKAYSKTLLEDKPTVAKLVKLVKSQQKGALKMKKTWIYTTGNSGLSQQTW